MSSSENSSNQTPTPLPAATSEPKRYFEPPPDHPANDLSPRPASFGFTDAVKTIKLEDFTKVHHNPCFREANLNGMGAGFAVGGLRYIIGGTVPKACNWAVGSFMLVAIGSYEYCVVRRRLEKAAYRKISAAMEAKKLQKEKQMAERKERALQAAVEREAAAAAAAEKQSSWKFW